MKDYINELKKLQPMFWRNDELLPSEEALLKIPYSIDDVLDAENRLKRFAPYFIKVYPETIETNGIIESQLHECIKLNSKILYNFNVDVKNKIFLKMDCDLPISGSVKARGGVYEIVKHAEELAVKEGILNYEDDYGVLAEERFKKFFGKYSIAVGSTGNLGLSIGIVGADLGFNVNVHMSRDAKQWKKDLLRTKGVNVIEYENDYCIAVETGRKQALSDPNMYFVDDENSTDLFFGYAVSAIRLKKQLDDLGYKFSENKKLKIYIPCGIGGAPGGITFGIKLVFGDSAQCYFGEPTHAPCMLLGLAAGKNDEISVYDIGIDGKTEADGLAVARPSKFVGKTIKNLISGCYTVEDDSMYEMLYLLDEIEGIKVEPSAAVSVFGPIMVEEEKTCLHLCWLTGGNMVPDEIMWKFIEKGKKLIFKGGINEI